MAKNKNRDERAIQTYFRTLSRNQYNVLAMIDRKASGTNHKFLTILKKITFFDRKIKWPLQEDKLQHHRYQ